MSLLQWHKKRPPEGSNENRKKLLQAPLLHWKILFSQASRKDLIILSKSIIFKPPISYSLIVESLVTLSVPFHKNLNIIWFNSLTISLGTGRSEEM